MSTSLRPASGCSPPAATLSKAPDVVSNSWGGASGIDEWFRPAVQAWRAAGIVPVFANGNSGPGAGTVNSPGNYPEVIGVGATTITDDLATFSSRGPSPYDEIKPEVSAPGAGIRSSVPGGTYEGGWNGTSMATPHVTGVVALLRQVNASLTPDEIEEILESTAVPRTDSTYTAVPNNGYGYGIVNAFDAVSSVLTGRGTLSGRVATDGDDLDGPVITHTPVTEAYTGRDIPIQAEVSDNVSVTEVSLYARMQGAPYYTIIPMNRTAGDVKSGTYAAAIPGYLVQVPVTQYYIRAVDYGNSPASTAVANVAVSPGLQPGYTTDMETEPVGWTHAGNSDPWQWGAPTSGPQAAHSGSNLYATNLAGDYANSTNAYLATPPLDLTGAVGAVFQYWQWHDFESNYDFGDVWVIDGAGVQTRLLHQTGATNGWERRSIDLTPYAGQMVTVLFNMTSDGSGTRPGWYLDDVALLAPDTASPAAPANLTGDADSMGSVHLAWDNSPEGDMASYRVYRSSASGSGYALLGTATTPGFTDGGAPSGVPSYYVVSAVDLWGNESDYSNEFAITPVGPTVLFFDNMEGTDNGWTHGGTADQWQHGAPTSGPGSAYSGTQLWATNLAGDYSDSANAWLMSPSIALSGVSGASLQFAHWYSFETNWDFGYVEVSADGGTTWTLLGTRFTGANNAYTQPTYDLTPYVGQTVQVRFRMTSDTSVVRPGWYVDDVKVFGTAQTTADGAWVPTKDPAKAADEALLYQGSQFKPGDFEQDVAGSTGGSIQSLPIEATITILETGRSVRTNPANGAYTITHAAGDYTARAESYGYFPVDQAVAIPADGSVVKNFRLEPIPTGTVQGVVTNARTGARIAGATVTQAEDGHAAPVTTAEDGSYSLTLLEGAYTLRVSASNYKLSTAEVTVTGGETVTQDAALEPFIGLPGELAYDDGTAENARAFYDAGNGWAVRMSPDPTHGSAVLQYASFYIWDNTWPAPGGTEFSVAVYDNSGPDGAPGRMVAGPIAATAERGAWNEVDLSELALAFDQDFYVTWVQEAPYPNSPGLGTDESGPNAERSWELVSGSWGPSPVAEGNYMIRAGVKYELTAPVITSPADGSATAEPVMVVEGTAAEGSTVNLYQDNVLTGSGPVTHGQFGIAVTLHDGANALTATAEVADGQTRPSAPVNVILDRVAPELTVTAPEDDSVTNRDAVTVTGTVTDDYLADVKVNGQAATVADGAFSHRLLLNEGANLISIVAADTAGNTTTVERHVTVNTAGPELSAVEPAADVTLAEGESLTISFDSAPGLTAGYQIVLTGNGTSGTPPNMQETQPGHYEGTYTAPTGTSFTGATIQVWARDSAGNVGEAEAAGHLTVTAGSDPEPENQPPVAQMVLPKAPKAKQNARFDGSTSSDPDGTIAAYAWSFGDGANVEGAEVTHRYAKKGTYTVTLTVTDDKGATATKTAELVVK